MGTLDIILLLCFIPAIVRGMQKGFVEQLVALVSIVLGAWLAFEFSSLISAWLAPIIQLEPRLVNILIFVIIVIITVLLLQLLGNLIVGVLKMADLNFLNRLLGVVFAILKAALVIGLIILLFESLNFKLALVKPETLNASAVYCTLRDISQKVFPYLESLWNSANA